MKRNPDAVHEKACGEVPGTASKGERGVTCKAADGEVSETVSKGGHCKISETVSENVRGTTSEAMNEKMTEEATEKMTDETAEKAVGKKTEKMTGETAEKMADKTAEKAVDEAAEKMVEKLNEKANEKKILSALGLCVRAGKVVFGVPMVCEALRRNKVGRPVSVWEAGDTSDNTHKKITDKCNSYGVKHIRLACGGDVLAAALGKTGSLGAVAVTDTSLSRLAEKFLTAND